MTEERDALHEALLAKILSEEPIMEYAFLDTGEVNFEQRIRRVCEMECPRYGTSWSCPPAVGTVEECRDRCRRYREVFIFSTLAEVSDILNLEETLATRMEHEEVTRRIAGIFREITGEDVLVLSTESCEICRHCAYPDAPCRFPDRMFPCVESYGIVVTELAEKTGMSFYNGNNVITWFSVVFF